MKSFLTTCLRFGLPVLALLAGIGFLADGYIDQFYLKCTTGRQTSMIIGISRAEEALLPAVFDTALAVEYPHLEMYNFAFTLHWSSFGRVYFNAIAQKLEKSSHRGVFIVTVDPWSIANFKDEQDDVEQFRENKSGLAKTRSMTMHPNYFYLVNAYSERYISVLTTSIETHLLKKYPYWLLHDDGWLELSVPMDSASVAKRFRTTFDLYSSYLSYCTISPIRKSWLIKTVAFLQKHGDVYLVRMPVHPAMLNIDNAFYPQFNRFIDSVARQQHVPYFNFSDSCSKYTYIDGGHLYKSSGKKVSEELSQLILNYRHAH